MGDECHNRNNAGTTLLIQALTPGIIQAGYSVEKQREVFVDTCHVWDGGYDIVNDLESVLKEFDRVIGLDRLKAVHFNDSMNDCGSHKDRHARIGEGKIGAEAMRHVAVHPLLEGRPFILETPNDDEGYKREIHLVREWTK